MKSLLPAIRTAWIVAASIVTVVVIGREITNEMRPQVKPDMPRILARLESAIQELSPDTHQFTITITGDSDILRVSDANDGVTPLLSMDAAGHFTITATKDELVSSNHDTQSFMLLCRIAGIMKSNSASQDFDTWIADATNATSEETRVQMFVGGRFKAVHSVTNEVVQVTVLN